LELRVLQKKYWFSKKRKGTYSAGGGGDVVVVVVAVVVERMVKEPPVAMAVAFIFAILSADTPPTTVMLVGLAGLVEATFPIS
jgi:hypothetical protein